MPLRGNGGGSWENRARSTRRSSSGAPRSRATRGEPPTRRSRARPASTRRASPTGPEGPRPRRPTPRRTPSRWPRACGGPGARTSGSKGRTRCFQKRAPSSPAGSCRRRGEGGEVRFHPAQRGAPGRVGDALGARRHRAGPPRVALARAERARPARRRARRRDLRGLRGEPPHLRRPEGLRGAAPARRARVARARGAHHARERPGRRDARLRQAPRWPLELSRHPCLQT